MAAWANAAVFAAVGLMNLAGIRSVRDLYARWDVPAGIYRTIGLVDIAAAALLATPHFRSWGVVVAAAILFGSGVMLLNHRHYHYAMAVIVMFVGLGAASLAIPSTGGLVQYAIESPID